jgi:hypothetical protein
MVSFEAICLFIHTDVSPQFPSFYQHALHSKEGIDFKIWVIFFLKVLLSRDILAWKKCFECFMPPVSISTKNFEANIGAIDGVFMKRYS